MGESFRSKSGFTMVQNTVARDPKISEKALGLYVRIQCYITLPDPISKRFIMNHCSSGEKAFESSWKELQKLGYLKTYQYRSPNSVTFDTEHDLLQVAEPDTPYFYIVTRPSNKITSVWYYTLTGTAEARRGLRQCLTGILVEEPDRRILGQLLTCTPQNGGDCFGITSFAPSSLGEDSSVGNILTTNPNTINNTVLHTSFDVLVDSLDSHKYTQAIFSDGYALTRSLYQRYATTPPTKADVFTVLQCVCIGEADQIAIDPNRVRLLAYAFDQARAKAIPGNWNYINGVLANLKQRGLDTLDAIETYDMEREGS